MNEEPNFNPSVEPDQAEPDLVSLLKRMQQQLLHLEKKVDLLLSRSQEKSFEERPSQDRPFHKRPFSKPFRSFDRSPHHGKGEREREHSPRERGAAPGHFYDRRPKEKSRSVGPRKKPFVFKRKDRD
jgi:hypothetical protein